VTLPDPTIVAPGYVALSVECLGAIDSFDDGELARLTLTVTDADTMQNATDPETVKIEYIVDHGTPVTLTWQYANWDKTTVPFPVVAAGVIGRTAQGKFETWLDTTAKAGTWHCQAVTTGAGQGASDILSWYVTPQQVP